MSRIPRQRLSAFLDMLAAERGAARNTLEAYERDVSDYLVFLAGKPLEQATSADIRGWLADLAARGLKASSAARRLSAVRQFHRFLYTEGLSGSDPAAAIEGPRLLVRVIDNGVGIGAEDLKRIGDPFFQAGKTYQRRHEGTGLGLSIVKSLVALHGGEMTVDSRLGEGTTVVVALPVVFAPPVARPSSNIATLAPPSRAELQQMQVRKRA